MWNVTLFRAISTVCMECARTKSGIHFNWMWLEIRKEVRRVLWHYVPAIIGDIFHLTHRPENGTAVQIVLIWNNNNENSYYFIIITVVNYYLWDHHFNCACNRPIHSAPKRQLLNHILCMHMRIEYVYLCIIDIDYGTHFWFSVQFDSKIMSRQKRSFGYACCMHMEFVIQSNIEMNVFWKLIFI